MKDCKDKSRGRRTRDNSLAVEWSVRERDITFYNPPGPQTKTDARLMHILFSSRCPPLNSDLIHELESRGYDIKTLRFSIMKDPSHPRWNINKIEE